LGVIEWIVKGFKTLPYVKSLVKKWFFAKVISEKQPADTWAGTESQKVRLTSVIQVHCTKTVSRFSKLITNLFSLT